MNAKQQYYLGELVKNERGASSEQINSIQKQIDFDLPQDYIDLMKEFNGGEGEVGENGWLCLFPVEELVNTNNDYILLMEQIPEYFLFGKDAADTAYSFHKKTHVIHSFGLMSDFKTDSIYFCGKNFDEFIEYLYNM